jgi:hypothetical protein
MVGMIYIGLLRCQMLQQEVVVTVEKAAESTRLSMM